jgi:hypothetical protein
MTAVRTLMRSCQKRDKYRFVTFLYNRMYDELLSVTGHEFYYWNHKVAKEEVPSNFFPINETDLPINLEVDGIICQDIHSHYNNCRKFADFWQIPLINILNYARIDEPRVRADINIYPSPGIQESWGEIGAIITPGVDENFVNFGYDKTEKIILTQLDNEAEVAFCKEALKGLKDIKIQSIKSTKQERLEQYNNAIGLLNLNAIKYPQFAFEGMNVGLPLLTVPNPSVDGCETFKTIIECRSKLENMKNLPRPTVQTATLAEFVDQFNLTMSFIDDYIYVR